MAPKKKKKEIALLGGAFDPVTLGHIQVAEYVLAASRIFSEVWLMPCFSHVYDKHMVPSQHRLKMCEIAAAASNRIRVFDYEIRHQLTRGTYYLIRQLLTEDFSRDYHYSMIIGQDNANTFNHWIRYKELAEILRFVVVPRKGVSLDHQVSWYWQAPHIYLTKDCQVMQVSSTKVRNLLAANKLEGVKPCVHPGVLEYILEHRLYQVD